MDLEYVQNADRPDLSWHVNRTWTRVPGRALALCGRTIPNAANRFDRPAEKTCETCLRIAVGKKEV